MQQQRIGMHKTCGIDQDMPGAFTPLPAAEKKPPRAVIMSIEVIPDNHPLSRDAGPGQRGGLKVNARGNNMTAAGPDHHPGRAGR